MGGGHDHKEKRMSGASGGKVHVEHGAMVEQAQRLAQAKEELVAKLQEVQSQIQTLVSTGFATDSASGWFAAAHERWNTAARNCVEELEVMGQYLNKTSQAFADVDNQYTVKI